LKVKTYLKWVLLIVILIPFRGAFLYAQKNKNNHYIRHFSTKDGLYNNHIRSIAQDKTGFLWIATWDGLTRFDGYEFKSYYHEPDDSSSLPGIVLHKICVDRFNNVWVFANRSVCRYNRKNDNFIRCNNHSNSCKIQSNLCSSINLDNYGNLWLLGDKGCDVWVDNKKFVHYNFKNKSYCDTAFQIYFDSKNNIWLFLEKYLYKCSNPTISYNVNSEIIVEKKIKYYVPKPNTDFLNYNYKINRLIYSRTNDTLWICTNHGLYYLNVLNNKIKSFDGHFNPNSFDKNTEPLIWSSIEKGLDLYDPRKNFRDSVREIGGSQEAFFIDRQNIIWSGGVFNLSNEGTGLYMIYNTGNFFKYYLDNTDEKIKYTVFGVYQDSLLNIWVGIDNFNYILRIHPGGLLIDSLNYVTKVDDRIPCPMSFLDDKKGNLWIAYRSGYLYKYNFKKDSFLPYNYDLKVTNGFSFQTFGFKVLKKYKDGNIIAGGDGKYCCFNPDNKTVIFGNSPIHFGVYSVLVDRDSNIWIGCSNELILIKNSTYETHSYSSRMNSNIECIVEVDPNYLWLAFFGQGIGQFDKKTGYIKFYRTHDGLSNNSTYNILVDNSNRFWISTNRGISMFNPKTEEFWNFGPEDGLKIEEFNSKAAYKCKDGQMLFGGMGGVVGFYPDSLKQSSLNYYSPIIFLELKVLGDTIFEKNIYEQPSITIKPGSESFELAFTCPDFRNTEKIQFRYYIEGDNDTLPTDFRNRKASFTNLKPGKYNVCVEATDNDGEFSRRASIEIIIPPLFKQTFWYKLIIILVTIILLSPLIIVVILHRKKRQKDKVIELTDAIQQKDEEEFTQNIHDVIGSELNFASSSLKSFIKGNSDLKDAEKDKLEITMSHLINTKESLKVIVKNTLPQSLKIAGFLPTLKDLIDTLNKSQQIRFEIEEDEKFPELNEMEAWQLYKVFRELINNILKHSKAKVVIISITCDKKLRLMIKDDGVGFDQKLIHHPTGMGLENIKRRITALKGNIIKTDVQKGTEFIIEFRIKNNRIKY